MSITDPFYAGRWVERLLLLRGRISDPADEWRHAPHLPWESADPESNPVRFEAVGIESPWSLSRSEAGFVGGILRQFTRSRESAFAYTFAASVWDYLQQRNKACAMLRRALETDPDYVPAYVVRANLSHSEDWFESGLADVKRALALNPDYVPALVTQLVFEPNPDNSSTEELLNRVMHLNPGYADTYVIGSLTMRAVEEDDWAVDYLNRALELDPDNVEAYRMRADAWTALFEWEEALDDLTECLNRAPSNTDVRLTKATYTNRVY